MKASSPAHAGIEPHTLALAALGWVLEDGARARRFLDVTGLCPDSLRAGLADPGVLASVAEFLNNHEPDLLRAAEALAVAPEQIAALPRELAR